MSPMIVPAPPQAFAAKASDVSDDVESASQSRSNNPRLPSLTVSDLCRVESGSTYTEYSLSCSNCTFDKFSRNDDNRSTSSKSTRSTSSKRSVLSRRDALRQCQREPLAEADLSSSRALVLVVLPLLVEARLPRVAVEEQPLTLYRPKEEEAPRKGEVPATCSALVLHVREERKRRGVEPDELIRDRTHLPEGKFDRSYNDPPGEDPGASPIVNAAPVNMASGGRYVNDHDESTVGIHSRTRFERRCRPVKWVDPRSVEQVKDVDAGVLRSYEKLVNRVSDDTEGFNGRGVDPPAHNAHSDDPLEDSDAQTLLSNRRMRIATISSGYKKANFFVREDLDTRIYFHEFEDAVGYMAKRGYSRMPAEEEKEWKELLGRAHCVVKSNGFSKKEKQRYRKGKVVLVLKKMISDKKTVKPSPTSTALVLVSSDASTSSRDTSRTSLNKLVRGEFESYSEKFMAERDWEKKQVLTAIREGAPADSFDLYNAAHAVLMLAEGPSGDPDADADAVSTTSLSRSGFDRSDVSDGKNESSTACLHASTRRGVYNGGVRYFAPYQPGSDDEEDESEEESASSEEDSCETEEIDMTSASGEGSYYAGAAVESVYTGAADSESLQSERSESVQLPTAGRAGRRRPKDPPPELAPVSDESASSYSS